MHIHFRFYAVLFYKGKIFTFFMLLSSGDSDESINENQKYGEDSGLVAAFKGSMPTPVGDGKDRQVIFKLNRYSCMKLIKTPRL